MPRTSLRRLTAAVLAGAALTTAVVLHRRVEVAGGSMLPTLERGDRLLLLPLLPGRMPRPGDLVGVLDPRDRARLMVKRVEALQGNAVVVAGDNPDASTDSRHFGPVPRNHLRGRVVYRYAPEHRRGRVLDDHTDLPG